MPLPGLGEYERRGRSFLEVARMLFLKAVQKVEPKVLENLQDGPFKVFLRGPVTADELPDALKQWLKQWHFPCPPEDDDWCFQRALDTLQAWRTHREWRGKQWAPARAPLYVQAIDPRELAFSFTLKEPDPTKSERETLDWWEPQIERKADATSRVDKAFQQAWKAHVEKVEHLFTRGVKKRPSEEQLDWPVGDWPVGHERTPQKRALEHFEWLARYQVQEWSYEEIRRHYDLLQRKTVEAGVKDAKALVGLELRPAKRGRPPGAKDSPVRQRHLSEAGVLRRRKKGIFAH